MRRVLIALALVLTMLSAYGHRRRSIMSRVEQRVEGLDRYVDIGVRLNVVRADPKGKTLLEGCPPMVVLRSTYHGGIVDTKASPPRLIGSGVWRDWYCSEDQHAALVHEDPAKLAQLIYGSEGAGKTRLLAMWHYFRWLEHLGEGREGGQTAPTLGRLGLVKLEMLACWGPDWARYVARDEFEGFEMCDGTRIRFRYALKQREAAGAPIQGFNWAWCGADEAQDQTEAHADIQARGRSAPRGQYKQLRTATAKDSPEWRTLRDQLEGSGLWLRRTLLGERSPFVWPSHWESMRKTMSDREYKRRVLAMDLPPETAVYPDWSRESNLVTVPELGWADVTTEELRGSGPNLAMLVGHDPGLTQDVSVFLKAYVSNQNLMAYRRGLARCMWVVLGECNTEGTTETHLSKLLGTVRERWGLNYLDRQGRPSMDSPQILVRADPAGNTDNRTDKTVYTQFANAGIRIKPGAYNADNDGHGRVPREPGVELVNTLIRNAAGERRLFVARNPDGSPSAPMLVKALESSERDPAGKAEVSRKGKGDMTHWPATLRYALWAIERPRLQLLPKEEV